MKLKKVLTSLVAISSLVFGIKTDVLGMELSNYHTRLNAPDITVKPIKITNWTNYSHLNWVSCFDLLYRIWSLRKNEHGYYFKENQELPWGKMLNVKLDNEQVIEQSRERIMATLEYFTNIYKGANNCDVKICFDAHKYNLDLLEPTWEFDIQNFQEKSNQQIIKKIASLGCPLLIRTYRRNNIVYDGIQNYSPYFDENINKEVWVTVYGYNDNGGIAIFDHSMPIGFKAGLGCNLNDIYKFADIIKVAVVGEDNIRDVINAGIMIAK